MLKYFLSGSLLLLLTACSVDRSSLWVDEDVPLASLYKPPKCLYIRKKDMKTPAYKVVYDYIYGLDKKIMDNKCQAYLYIRKTENRLYFSSVAKDSGNILMTISHSISSYMIHRKDLPKNVPLSQFTKEKVENSDLVEFTSKKDYFNNLIKDMGYTLLIHIDVLSRIKRSHDISYNLINIKDPIKKSKKSINKIKNIKNFDKTNINTSKELTIKDLKEQNELLKEQNKLLKGKAN